jgi:hypothetical protein
MKFIEKSQKTEVNRPCPCYLRFFPIICSANGG